MVQGVFLRQRKEVSAQPKLFLYFKYEADRVNYGPDHSGSGRKYHCLAVDGRIYVLKVALLLGRRFTYLLSFQFPNELEKLNVNLS
jgi:hypothetical protein